MEEGVEGLIVSWRIRDSKFCEFENPTRDQIAALVARLRTTDPPILILENSNGEAVETACLDPEGFILAYSSQTGELCSAEVPVSESTVVDVLNGCAREETTWSQRVVWRLLFQPDENSSEVRALVRAAHSLAAEVANVTRDTPPDVGEWLLRGVIHRNLSKRIPASLARPDEYAQYISYDLERYVLRILSDSMKGADA